MLRKTVPDLYSGDWKSLLAVGWESVMENRQTAAALQTPFVVN